MMGKAIALCGYRQKIFFFFFILILKNSFEKKLFFQESGKKEIFIVFPFPFKIQTARSFEMQRTKNSNQISNTQLKPFAGWNHHFVQFHYPLLNSSTADFSFFATLIYKSVFGFVDRWIKKKHNQNRKEKQINKTEQTAKTKHKPVRAP